MCDVEYEAWKGKVKSILKEVSICFKTDNIKKNYRAWIHRWSTRTRAPTPLVALILSSASLWMAKVSNDPGKQTNWLFPVVYICHPRADFRQGFVWNPGSQEISLVWKTSARGSRWVYELGGEVWSPDMEAAVTPEGATSVTPEVPTHRTN